MEAPGEKLVIRLWDTIVDKGISGLLAPWQTRRKDRAAADGVRQELLALAQTEQDVKDIRAGRKTLDARGHLVEVPAKSSSLPGAIHSDQAVAAVAERNRIARDVRAELNTSKALLIAEAVLEADPQPPPGQVVDDDWLFRWRDAASTVSSEELQELWGRALAGEIKSPGSCSLRTLEFLKNLSHDEARQIATLSPFVLAANLIVQEPETEEFLKDAGITGSFLLNLQTLGVVSGFEGVGWQRTIRSSRPDRFERGLLAHDRVLLATHDDATKEFHLRGCFLTPVGQQVTGLGSFTAHEAYLRGVAKVILANGFKVSLACFEPIDSNEIRIIEPEEILV